MRDPEKTLPTIRLPGWLGPGVLAVGFLAVLGSLLWLMQARSMERERADLLAGAATAQESIHQRLVASRDYLVLLAEDMARGAVDEGLFLSRLGDYMRAHLALVSVIYVNADGLTQWAVPSDEEGKVVGLPPACRESRIGHETVRHSHLPVYSGAHISVGGEPAFDVSVPIFRGEEFVGTLVGVHSCDRLLRNMVHREIIQKHQVSLVDGDGRVITGLPTAARIDERLVHRVVLNPPGKDVHLRLARYGSGFWGVGLTLLSVLCVALAAGMAWGMWSLNAQVAKRARAEESLREARDGLALRVRERTADLERANTQLQEEMRQRRDAEHRARQRQEELAHVARVSTMGEMAAGLAHELNQPLGTIATFAEGGMRLVESGAADQDNLRTAMEEISEQAVRAGRIIHRLRAFVAHREPRTMPEDLRTLTEEVVDLLALELREGQVALRMEFAPDLPRVLVDAVQVQQVLLNLMRNAVEAMSSDGQAQRGLDVSARLTDADGVEVQVRDTGPGCSQESVSQLFEAFYTTKERGLGMGLSISRSIIEAHGGRLWAEQDTGRGMTMRFTLPAASGESNE
jgi:signal transduction histidine kinase